MARKVRLITFIKTANIPPIRKDIGELLNIANGEKLSLKEMNILVKNADIIRVGLSTLITLNLLKIILSLFLIPLMALLIVKNVIYLFMLLSNLKLHIFQKGAKVESRLFHNLDARYALFHLP